MPPLCKGRCRTDEGRLTEGLLLSREITLGTTTPQSACASQLPPAHRNVPLGHSGVAVGLFPQRVHSTLCSKTLDLQVRFAHPTGNFAPKRPFGTFRCSAWLIFRFRTDPPSVRRCSARLIRQAETLELQPRSRPPSKRTALSVGKRSCSRFAALTLRLRTETPLRDIPVFRMACFP